MKTWSNFNRESNETFTIVGNGSRFIIDHIDRYFSRQPHRYPRSAVLSENQGFSKRGGEINNILDRSSEQASLFVAAAAAPDAAGWSRMAYPEAP